MNGDIIVSGGAPYNDCFLEGCMDEIACNYNINATIDNDSCEYPEEGSDCNDIYLQESIQETRNLHK